MTAVYLLTADVVAAVLLGPAATVFVQTRTAVAGVILAIAGWLAASAAALIWAGLDLQTVVVTHVVLTMVAVTMVGFGAAVRRILKDALDAIAVAACICGALAFGLFAAGNVVEE